MAVAWPPLLTCAGQRTPGFRLRAPCPCGSLRLPGKRQARRPSPAARMLTPATRHEALGAHARGALPRRGLGWRSPWFLEFHALTRVTAREGAPFRLA